MQSSTRVNAKRSVWKSNSVFLHTTALLAIIKAIFQSSGLADCVMSLQLLMCPIFINSIASNVIWVICKHLLAILKEDPDKVLLIRVCVLNVTATWSTLACLFFYIEGEENVCSNGSMSV